MTKTSLLSRGAALAAMMFVAAASVSSAYAAAPAASGAAPLARILIVDLRRAVGASKVGQSIQTQVNALKEQAQKQLAAEADGLRRERETLMQQGAILAANVKAQKEAAWKSRAAAFDKKMQERSLMIQGGMIKANQQVEQALEPILQGLMVERQASVLLDRGSVLLAPPGLDVTGVVVQRLDTKLSTVKVELTAVPPELAAAAAARQQQAQQ